jgi:hypothetical protein
MLGSSSNKPLEVPRPCQLDTKLCPVSTYICSHKRVLAYRHQIAHDKPWVSISRNRREFYHILVLSFSEEVSLQRDLNKHIANSAISDSSQKKYSVIKECFSGKGKLLPELVRN